MLRGEIPPKFSITAGCSFWRAFFLPSAPFAVHSSRRALLSPCTFLIGHFYREAFALPLFLAWSRVLSHAALTKMARHFVWTPAQGFWTDRASLLGSGERVGPKRCDYTCWRITPTLIPSITHSV